jgi:peptide/nickel transport system ATP-binding protein
MALLEVKDLHTHIRLRRGVVRAVEGVSFEVEAGETVGLVGESGCGKTVSGLSIMRLLPPAGRVVSGSIFFGGRDLVRLSEAEMRQVRGNEIAMVFQDPMTSLNPTMTIGRQIAEAVVIHKGVSWARGLERAREVLGLVGMPNPDERLNYYPHQLSGGLRQRVMIAMALACDPKLLIADEPTTALDVTIQKQILELLDDLKAQIGMAMLLITHDLGVIAGRADRVVVMYAGRVVEEARTEELFFDTRHPYTEALMESIPQLDQDSSRPLYSIPGLPPDLSKPISGCPFAPRCRHATGICFEREPPLEEEASGHRFACFHPVSRPVVGGQVGALGLDVSFEPRGRVVAGQVVVMEPPGPEDGLVVLDGVSKEFPVTSGAVLQRRIGTIKAVSDVSFAIREGETFGLVGESGCGKSTIGRLVVALEKPTSGRVFFSGHEISRLTGRKLRKIRRDLQLMFQDPYASLDPRMRVATIVAEPLVIQGVASRAERRRIVADLLAEVGLPVSAAERFPHEFSGGQRQRIGLARALALRPKLIVADEPVSALDVSIRSQILNLMKQLQADHGLTYLFISHDLAVVRYLADRIGVMYLGKLVEVGSAEDIYSRPAHPYTAGLLAAIPVPHPTLERSKRGVILRGELPSQMNPPSGCRFRTRCPLAEEVCAVEEPPMVRFGREHYAACYFPLEAPGLAEGSERQTPEREPAR